MNLNIRRNMVYSLVELVINLVLVFISYRIIVRTGGIALLGVWSTLFAWLSLIRIGDIGIGGAITRFVAGLDLLEDRKRIVILLHTGIVSNIFIYTVLVAVAGAVFSNFVSSMVGTQFQLIGVEVLPWMLFGLLCNNIATVVLSSLVALHVGYQRSVMTIFGNIIQLCLAVILIPTHGLVGFAIAQIVQFIFLTLVGWYLVSRALGQFELPHRFSWSALREMLSFSLNLQSVTLVNALWEPLSKILVSRFGGMHFQGLYEAAFKTVFLSRNVAVQASSATIPAMTRLAHAEPIRARDLYVRIYRMTLILLAAGMSGCVIGAPLISLFWFGSIEITYIVCVAILILGVSASGWSAAAYNLGISTGRLRGNLIATGSSLAFLALFGTACGLIGSPMAIIITNSMSLIVSAFLVVLFNERLIGITRKGWRLISPA